ncbi:MAG: 4Fe-4S binding protein [Deltaproteobacteria bacterium]|nr:4Fe-4S binding protein [Deltaproteobacteria bacterium]MBI5893196.1 4Fe-4S binding protein [Deltaproteobacteria bacterium]
MNTEALHNYPIVKQEYCVMRYKCVNCVAVCRARAVKAVPYYADSDCGATVDRLESKKAAFIEQESCERCGVCYQVCPTGAIEDKNAEAYMKEALSSAGEGKNIVFACTHTGLTTTLNSELQTLNSELIFVPDLSIISWRDVFKIMSMGSPVMMFGCEDCAQTSHFKQMEDIFANSCYEGVFRFYDNKEQVSGIGYQEVSDKGHILDENILEQVITSYTGKIPFPGTAWVDIGERCTLCRNCANVCPTGALRTKMKDGKTALLYEHNLCKGCPICEKACPERCITIDRRLRPDSLFTVDNKCEKNLLLCRGCDEIIATDAVFERIRNILTAHGQSAEQLEYCPDCKARGLGAGRNSSRVEENSATLM